MAEAYYFKPPQPLDLNNTDGNLCEIFKDWKRELEIYLNASGACDKSKKIQSAILLNLAGPTVVKAVDQFVFDDDEDKQDPDKVLDKIEEYCTGQRNEVLQTFKFWKIEWKEPFDIFLTDLRRMADSCSFADKDRMIRDKIVFSVNGKLQERLLRDNKLTLVEAIKLCRAAEASIQHAKEMKAADAKVVNRVYKEKYNGKPPREAYQSPKKPLITKKKAAVEMIKDCAFCGKEHEKSKYKCPALNATCDHCKGRHHFKIKCKKLHGVKMVVRESDTESDSEWLSIAAIKGTKKKKAYAMMQINKENVRFQLDSGSEVNTICQKYVHKSQMKETSDCLVMWNDTKQKPLGVAYLEMINPKTNESQNIRFLVVKNDFECLLGCETSEDSGLITVNRERFIANICSESELGYLGEATLVIDPDVPAKALPSRKIPLALKNDVKEELDRLVKKGVLVSEEEPTKWVSQMAVVRKSSGALRICIDPQPLNKALQREHYKLPTLDDVLPQLNKAKIFSKLDVKEAFWHIKIDENSSKLTTMLTPFGRFRWKRLPFGLKVSSEIFQRRLHEAIGDLDGIICVADDIIVVGCGDDKTSAEQDHDQKLKRLRDRCRERNIKLNEKKSTIKSSEITFLGHKITKSGISPHEQKVKAIREMPVPTDSHGVKRLCGMVQYVARFIPNLASILQPLRDLTKQDVPWKWTALCDKAFTKVKEKLMEAPVLAYFDPDKELVVQVDSSKDGVGAVLLQEGRPIEYASRALTSSERNWAQIEKESLSVVFGLERFDQYTYGRKVIIENDHKPLSAILRKPLSQAPKRLQALMLRLHRYDIDFKWIAGKDLVIADALSRAFIDEEVIRVMNIDALKDIPDNMLKEVKRESEKDECMQELEKCIREGWPERKCEVKDNLKPYFDYRETLSHQDSIILKGERIVIPKALRKTTLTKLHAAHLGNQSMLRRARQIIFWPSMSEDIKQLAEACEACQEMKPNNQKETLIQMADGEKPWERIGLDLFEINQKTYLITVDYYSGFIEIDFMNSPSSKCVIIKLKAHCARFGIPKEIISDNGAQFTSHEFGQFTENWQIKHSLSSPHHHQANGRAEAAVKVVKTMMKKCSKEGRDQYEALMELRNTPRQDTGHSPAQLMFGRKTRTLLPLIANSNLNDSGLIKARREGRKVTVKKSHDRRAKDMPKIKPGQTIRFKHKPEGVWTKAQVTERDDRSYVVKSEDTGGEYTRNRIHLRETEEKKEEEVDLEVLDSDNPPPQSDASEGAVQPAAQRPRRIRVKPAWMKDYCV